MVRVAVMELVDVPEIVCVALTDAVAVFVWVPVPVCVYEGVPVRVELPVPVLVDEGVPI
jgi:hypothetical protein